MQQSMHYYQHHIGDYLRDTAHLSLIEDAIYRRLLDHYYLHEKPLPENEHIVARIIRASEHVDHVKTVLMEFFEKTTKGWEQKRCNMEIREYGLICDRNKLNGKRGGRPRKTQSVISGNPDETQMKANHEPLTNITDTNVSVVGNEVANQSKVIQLKTKPQCPHQEIIALYHEIIHVGTRVKVWNGTRAAHLKARWNEDAKRQSLDYWRRLFTYCTESPFLMGRVNGKDRPPFQISLDWIVRPNNFAKIIEQTYHRDQA